MIVALDLRSLLKCYEPKESEGGKKRAGWDNANTKGRLS
jgi:hypothetical protein